MVLGSPICFIFSRLALYASIVSFVFDMVYHLSLLAYWLTQCLGAVLQIISGLTDADFS
jgi:hypothetical protein